MKRVTVVSSRFIALTLLMVGAVSAQAPESYLDVLVCKVKPEKRADFDAIGKKVADANRHNKGDSFLAMQTEYGAQNTVTFVSVRENYAAIDKANTAFLSAMKEAFGPAVPRMMQDFNNCLSSSRTELRRRRWDLSVNVPADPASVFKTIGEARWLRALAVHVQPGRVDEFEAHVKMFKDAMEKANGPMTLVSQAVAGQEGTVFYLSTVRNSLASFDAAPPSLRELLGESGYQQFQKSSAESVRGTETSIFRLLPELSNPPKEIADASPDFWTPKPAAASRSRAKPKAAPEAKSGQ